MESRPIGEQWQSVHAKGHVAGLLKNKTNLGTSERRENKGWMNREADMLAYLPSFTSAFSVNNTFCPLISL